MNQQMNLNLFFFPTKLCHFAPPLSKSTFSAPLSSRPGGDAVPTDGSTVALGLGQTPSESQERPTDEAKGHGFGLEDIIICAIGNHLKSMEKKQYFKDV